MKRIQGWVIRFQMRRNARLIDAGFAAEKRQRQLQAKLWAIEGPKVLICGVAA